MNKVLGKDVREFVSNLIHELDTESKNVLDYYQNDDLDNLKKALRLIADNATSILLKINYGG